MVLIAEALLFFSWKDISVFEKFWFAGNILGVVGRLNGPVVLDTTVEIGELGSSINEFLGIVNETVTHAVITILGTSSWDFLWFWLAPALLLLVLVVSTSEFGRSAIGPVVDFLGSGSPVSHFIEGFKSGTADWVLDETSPESTGTHALMLGGVTTEPWGIPVLWLSVHLKIETIISIVLSRADLGEFSGSTEGILEIWVSIDVLLGHVVGNVGGAIWVSALSLTGFHVVVSSVTSNITISCGIASDIGVRHTRWGLGRYLSGLLGSMDCALSLGG
jgi:hypothetical protein